jgi:hypothetical protein
MGAASACGRYRFLLLASHANQQTIEHRNRALRHIIGNPFRPYAAPASWPCVAVELAQSLYGGAGDRLVLADALEEAGHQELAEHFRPRSGTRRVAGRSM